jgi:hypothetical protein
MKIKKPKLSKLLKEADRVFSLFIRNRDNYRCVICGSEFRPQCGHLIKRGKKSVRFNEFNCHCQCAGCNKKHNYYPEHYTLWFIQKHGQGAYDNLVQESKKVVNLKVTDLQEIIKKYENK